jgi:hypothetical protein
VVIIILEEGEHMTNHHAISGNISADNNYFITELVLFTKCLLPEFNTDTETKINPSQGLDGISSFGVGVFKTKIAGKTDLNPIAHCRLNISEIKGDLAHLNVS